MIICDICNRRRAQASYALPVEQQSYIVREGKNVGIYPDGTALKDIALCSKCFEKIGHYIRTIIVLNELFDE